MVLVLLSCLYISQHFLQEVPSLGSNMGPGTGPTGMFDKQAALVRNIDQAALLRDVEYHLFNKVDNITSALREEFGLTIRNI